MNKLLNIPIIDDEEMPLFEYQPYTDMSGSLTSTTGFWNGGGALGVGSSPISTFSKESSVGQIFINDIDYVGSDEIKQSCVIEINTGNLVGKSIYDSSGNTNKGLIIGDYKVKKVRRDEPMRRDSFIKLPKKTSNQNGAL